MGPIAARTPWPRLHRTRPVQHKPRHSDAAPCALHFDQFQVKHVISTGQCAECRGNGLRGGLDGLGNERSGLRVVRESVEGCGARVGALFALWK